MKTLNDLLLKNKAWAEKISLQDPEFFRNLSEQQAPDYLWIGCSDSRVPANQIVGLSPGEMFVHRNIANVVVHSDLNCLSVIQYAVEVLEVKHIIVCGHYGCGGVKAAIDGEDHGLIDNWLKHIKDVSRLHDEALCHLSLDKKSDRLCEFNVIEQVKHVCETTIVQSAWKRGATLSVHGWIYSVENGILRDLDVCISSLNELEEKYGQ